MAPLKIKCTMYLLHLGFSLGLQRILQSEGLMLCTQLDIFDKQFNTECSKYYIADKNYKYRNKDATIIININNKLKYKYMYINEYL